MPINTTNFDLFKYDVDADANSTFNITKALNDNWDKLDANVSNKDLSNLSEAGLEVIKQNSGAEWGSITGELTNQTDLKSALDLKADKSELTKYNKAYITTTWKGTSSWYNVYSNGFIEQGIKVGASSNNYVNFVKPFATGVITACWVEQRARNNASYYGGYITSISKTRIDVYRALNADGTTGGWLYACGY